MSLDLDKVENTIKELKTKKNQRGKPIGLLTVSQIRNLLAMSADILNEVLEYPEENLSEELLDRVSYLTVRFYYEAGRDEKVKSFIETAKLLPFLKGIKTRKQYIQYYQYMEALVERISRIMYTKIQITGTIEVLTGMHIGGSSAFAAIGAVDSPVIKDVITGYPMIPGSSLKGKMRTLLAKAYNESVANKPDQDCERIKRVFGSAEKDNIKKSRIQISDMILSNDKDLRKKGLNSLTEVKFENTINRATAVANPRQIERVVRGSEFDLDILYEVDNMDDLYEDIELIAEAFKMLQYDYLGGSGSRGYGKVKFTDLYAETVIGQLDKSVEDKINDILSKVSQ